MTSAGRAWLLPLLVCAPVILLLPGTSSPAEIDVTSKTYVKFFQDARENAYAPLFEYVELESRDRVQGRWDFSLAAWAGADLKTSSVGGDRSRGDLSYAVLRYSPAQDRRLLLNVGRQFVFDGVATEQVDGATCRWEITPKSGVMLFGGSPVAAESDGRGGDTALGGRMYQRFPSVAEIGLSALYETNDHGRFRHETGVDLWLLPFRRVEVAGHSFFNNVTQGWSEHAYTLRLFPLKTVTLSGLFSRSNYDDAFASRTLSVFTPEFLGNKEVLTKTGGMAEYRIIDALNGIVDFTTYSYETMGDAGYYGARLTASISELSAGASIHRMHGSPERLRYLESRLYTAWDGEDWRLSLDAIYLKYDLPFNGLDNASSLNGTVRKRISEALIASLGIDFSKTPDFDRNTTALANLTYNFRSGR